jgi:hypothetical protein
MATRSELTQLLDNELQNIISSVYGISDATPHVAPARTQDNQKLPALNYETQVTPLKHGMHGESYVDEVNYDTSGSVKEIVFGEDKTLYFDVTASVGNDDVKERDELYEAVEDHFGVYDGKRRDTSDLHADIDEIRIQSTSDESRPDDAVRGDRISLEIDYTLYDSYTGFSTMESFETNINISEQDESSSSEQDYNNTINYTTN